MALRLVVKSATDLPKLDRFSKVDPYCELTFHEEKQSTTTISNNQNPEWNESFKWTLEVTPEATEVIEVLIADSETLGKNRPMCKGSIPLATVLEKGSASLDVSVVDPEGEPLETKLHVDLSYRAPVSETLKGELGTLKVRVEELEEELRNLKVTATQTETELTETKGQVEPLKTENTQAKTTIEELQAELSAVGAGEDLKAQNESLTKEIATLKQRIEELEEERRRQPSGVAQPASGESGDREQQPLIHETEERVEKKGCCTLL